MEETVFKFIKIFRTRISKSYFYHLIRSHPDFPSLLSISDTLQTLGILHVTHKVSLEDADKLNLPCLLPIESKRKVILIKNNKDFVVHNEDMKLWGGVALQAVEKTKIKIDDITNNEFYSNEIRNSYYGFILGAIVLILFTLSMVSSFTWLSFLTLGTSIIGCGVGYFLMAKQLGVTYHAIDSLCSAKGSNNCDKVLKSDVKLLGFDLSNLAISYFLFQVILTAFVGFSFNTRNETFLILFVLSTLTIPIILLSIFYQKFIVKSWCTLCLLVCLILFVQFVIFIVHFLIGDIHLSDLPSPLYATTLALLFLIVTFSVITVKTKAEQINNLSSMSWSALRIKNNPITFVSFLKSQKKVDHFSLNKEITIGNPRAPIKIIMVSNLYCLPCKVNHSRIEHLVSKYSDEICIKVRFVPIGDPKSTVGKSFSYLLSYWLENIVGHKDESRMTKQLLHDWFEQMDISRFKRKYKVNDSYENEAKKIESQHYSWVRTVGINSTPTFFINGYQLPKEYNLDDLIRIAPGIIEIIKQDFA